MASADLESQEIQVAHTSEDLHLAPLSELPHRDAISVEPQGTGQPLRLERDARRSAQKICNRNGRLQKAVYRPHGSRIPENSFLSRVDRGCSFDLVQLLSKYTVSPSTIPA